MSQVRQLLQGIAVVGTAVLVLAPSAHATKFSNQFVEFELPTQWKCGLEGAEWVCQSEDDKKKRDAIVVLAAKLKGDQDTLEKYQEYLKKPRVFSGPGGKSVSSDPKYASNKSVNNHLWVDSLHLESEIPGFFTRYLATVEKDIGVLVTYSVNKTKFADYQKQFEDMVASIKVFRKAGGMNAAAGANLFDKGSAGIAGVFPAGGQIDPGSGAVAAGTVKTKKEDSGSGMIGLILIIAVAGGGFIIWKKKQQG